MTGFILHLLRFSIRHDTRPPVILAGGRIDSARILFSSKAAAFCRLSALPNPDSCRLPCASRAGAFLFSPVPSAAQMSRRSARGFEAPRGPSHTDGKPCQVRSAQRRRLADNRSSHRLSRTSAWNCIKKAVAARSAVDPELRERHTGVLFHRVDQIIGLVRNRLPARL